MVDGLVSIIVPVYNALEYLESCIDSLVSQTYPNIEIILVDDGSDDGSGEICDRTQNQFDNVVVIHTENSGVSTARNIGLEHSKGEFIAFCDSDDKMQKRMIECLVKCIKTTGSDIACCNFFHSEDVLGNDIDEDIQPEIFCGGERYTKMFRNKAISGYIWNKLFRAKTIKDNKIEFDTDIHFYEDMVFTLKNMLKSEHKKMCLIDAKLYFYRENQNSAVHQKISPKRISSALGLEKVLLILEKSDCDKIFLNNIYSTLIKYCCRYHTVTLMSKINEKKEYTKMLEDIFSRNYGKYPMSIPLSVKDKCHFILMKLFVFLKK